MPLSDAQLHEAAALKALRHSDGYVSLLNIVARMKDGLFDNWAKKVDEKKYSADYCNGYREALGDLIGAIGETIQDFDAEQGIESDPVLSVSRSEESMGRGALSL